MQRHLLLRRASDSASLSAIARRRRHVEATSHRPVLDPIILQTHLVIASQSTPVSHHHLHAITSPSIRRPTHGTASHCECTVSTALFQVRRPLCVMTHMYHWSICPRILNDTFYIGVAVLTTEARQRHLRPHRLRISFSRHIQTATRRPQKEDDYLTTTLLRNRWAIGW